MRRRRMQPGSACCQLENLDSPAALAKARAEARRRHKQFVAAGVGAAPLRKHLNCLLHPARDGCVQRMRDKAGDADDVNVPRAHRLRPWRRLLTPSPIAAPPYAPLIEPGSAATQKSLGTLVSTSPRWGGWCVGLASSSE